jgi:hypothetical protein
VTVASPWSPSRLLGWARARRKTSFFAAQGFEPLAATISTTIAHLQRLWMEVIYSCLSAQSVSTDPFNLSPPLGVSQAVRREALMVLAHNKIAPPKLSSRLYARCFFDADYWMHAHAKAWTTHLYPLSNTGCLSRIPSTSTHQALEQCSPLFRRARRRAG